VAVRIISHRGLCRATPRGRRSGENTLAAFRAGIEALHELGQPPAIEFDVRRAADGTVVVVHDATLRRTLALPGRVARLTSEDLLDLGVPRLIDVLRAFPAAECHVEIKERGIAGAVQEAIEAAGSATRVVVSSFLWRELTRFRDGSPVRIALTTAFPTRRTVRAAVAAGAWAIHSEHRKTTAAVVEAAHAAGLLVNAWTVNTPRAYARMVRLGADAVFSDNPRMLAGS
jgi:glycerophosphoryl diester phosphodiesterase